MPLAEREGITRLAGGVRTGGCASSSPPELPSLETTDVMGSRMGSIRRRETGERLSAGLGRPSAANHASRHRSIPESFLLCDAGCVLILPRLLGDRQGPSAGRLGLAACCVAWRTTPAHSRYFGRQPPSPAVPTYPTTGSEQDLPVPFRKGHWEHKFFAEGAAMSGVGHSRCRMWLLLSSGDEKPRPKGV